MGFGGNEISEIETKGKKKDENFRKWDFTDLNKEKKYGILRK